jgi:type I restriction enzyme, S subunit
MTQTTETIPAGYKKTDVGIIPEDWVVKELGELLGYKQPTNYLVKSIEYSNKHDTPVLTAGKTFILGYTAEETGIFKELPTIIFDDFTTANKFVDFPFKAKSSAMKMLRSKDESVSLKFVFEKMQLIDFKPGEHKRYWISEYQNISIAIPKPEEQNAIANVLSDMDALIESLEKLIAKKKAIKQGAMQQLLTGEKRLPGFSGEWEIKELSEIGNTYGGLSGKTINDFHEGKYSYIPFMNIMNNPVIDIHYFDYVNILEGEKQNKAVKWDLFFNGSSETPEEVGMCSVLNADIPNLYLNSFCFGFRLNKNLKTDGIYLSYLFRSSIGRRLIYSLAQGATRYNLSKTSFMKLKIPYPSPEEQTAIANILSDMDAEIEKMEQKREKYISLKQGMMQQLLTGRIRLVKNDE